MFPYLLISKDHTRDWKFWALLFPLKIFAYRRINFNIYRLIKKLHRFGQKKVSLNLLGQSRHTQVLILILNKSRVWGCLIPSRIKFQTSKVLHGLEFFKYLFEHFQINSWELLLEWVSLSVISSLVIVYFSREKYLRSINRLRSHSKLNLLGNWYLVKTFLHFFVWFERILPIILFCFKLLLTQTSRLFYHINERVDSKNMERTNIFSYFGSKSPKSYGYKFTIIQPAFNSSKLAIEILGQGVKYVQS